MAVDGEPAVWVKVLHLLVLSFSWGMQVWISFITGFALVRHVSRHTFSLEQSKIFPVYFYCLLGSNAVNLAIYALHHPRELLESHESAMMALYVAAVVMACLNVWWLGPVVDEVAVLMREVEEEHGLGYQISMDSQREAYAKLREQDPKYRACNMMFLLYQGMSSLCNLIGFTCTTTNLIYAALNLSTI